MTIPLAYIDPGSGALIWQTLTAAGIGCTFFLRRIYMRIRRGKLWRSQKQ